MKKLSFIIVMVLATGFIEAQKTTYLTQGGYGNSATITQDAWWNLSANKIYATQNGSWNTLTIDQLGKDNALDLQQGGDNNGATIVQSTFKRLTDQNYALINQYGTSGKIDLTQKGYILYSSNDVSKHISDATQSGSGGIFNLVQGSPTSGVNSAMNSNTNSYLKQSGYDNHANLSQYGETNDSEITQLSTSNLNTVVLEQVNPVFGGNEQSKSWQYGNNSAIEVFQSSIYDSREGSNHIYAYSNQVGNSNTTKIEQATRDEQTVEATEQGNADILEVTQR